MEILLIRHGKPTGAVNPKLSALGFVHWVRNYHKSHLCPSSSPPKDFHDSLSAHFIVSSDLIRSIDSAYLCVNRSPDLTSKELREMDIPRYKFPFRFKAYTWLIVSRIFWMLGCNGKIESFKVAKMRARNATKLLQGLAAQHQQVAFFGHGLLNRYIAKELIKCGWSSSSQGKGYWSTIKLKSIT